MMKEQHDWKIKPEEGESLRDLAGQLEQHAMELMETAAEHLSKMGGSGCGLVPSFIAEKIAAKKSIHARRWEQVLKEMILDSKNHALERRLNVVNPGRMAMGSSIGLYGHSRETLKFKIFIGIDVSGSMSQEEIAYGLGVVQEIANTDMDIEVKVAEYDACIHRRYYLRSRGKPTPEVTGRGGTSFDPFFLEAKLGKSPDGKVFKPDLILNYTDGGAPMPSDDVRVSTRQLPLLWVLSSSGYMPSDHNNFGRVLRMDGRR